MDSPPTASFDHAEGEGGLPKVILRAADGAVAEIHLNGGHVTSWRPAPDGVDRLFLSSKSAFQEGMAIRGGVPVIFPQFAEEGPLPRHGFARTSQWTLVALDRTEQGAAVATLVFVDDARTRAIWPASFLLTLAVRVGGPQLSLALSVENTGDDSFSFAAALHSYLRVRDIAETTLVGLHGGSYRVSGRNAASFDFEESLRVRGEIDRVYSNAPKRLNMREKDRSMRVEAAEFPDVVVWNPGAERAAGIADLAPGDERNFLCVEAAAVNKPISLGAGRRWWGTQTLIAERADG